MKKTDICNIPDEDLVVLVRTKNKEFYEELVKRYQNKLLRYAKYLLFDSREAEDVVQAAFIKAYKNLNGFNVKKKFSSWIYRIVHNEAVNIIKKIKRRKNISLDKNAFLADKIKGKENIELNLEKKETIKITNKLLFKLPEKYKRPLILCFLEDKSYIEISEILRIPVNTVGTRISRGKALLKKICLKKGIKSYEG
ncbi:RNA polymerase sigma factor [Patescibacteria group bacterium]